MRQRISKNLVFYIGLIGYGIYSFLGLHQFPLIHSDELWLGGLSLAYWKQKSIFVTEPFFDLMPRVPHAIKSLFHLIQIPFIRGLGFDITSLRLVSLLFSIGAIILVYQILRFHRTNPWLATILSLGLAVNNQFLFAAHFARQEIVLVFLLLLAYYLYSTKHHIATAVLLGISIGIHPNSFIIGLMIGSLYLRDFMIAPKQRPNPRRLLLYGFILAGFAGCYIGLSYLGDSNFITNYFAYGKTLGVDASPPARLTHLIQYYQKIYYQIGGTYYIPNLQPSLNLLIGSLLLSVYLKIRRYPALISIVDFLLMMLAFQVGSYLIGRYNPTSLVFLIIPAYLLILTSLSNLSRIVRSKSSSIHTRDWNLKRFLPTLPYVLGLFIIGLNLISVQSATEVEHYADYQTTTQALQDQLEPTDVVLGNLNTYLPTHRFYDIRNLAYLPDSSYQTLVDYINQRQINTIIYYEEYDYIHRNPQWTILYGPDHYYPALQQLIDRQFEPAAVITSPYYGTRIIRYIDGYAWKISIYKRTSPPSDGDS